VLPGTVVTRYPGTLHGVDAEFLRQVSAELKARFIQMMTEMYDLKNYLFHRDLMLDYLEGYWIGADDDPTDEATDEATRAAGTGGVSLPGYVLHPGHGHGFLDHHSHEGEFQ
jgi:hypothetical protein